MDDLKITGDTLMEAVFKKVCVAGNVLLCFVIPAFSHTITLPENLVAKSAQVATVTSNVTFGEGPAVDPSGNLYFSDRSPSRIWKVTSGGNATVFKNPADDANGMVFDSEGRLIICVKKGLTRIEKDSNTTTLLKADTLGDEGPNDLALTSNGGIFFTSSVWGGAGKVFYRSSDGNVKTLLSFKYPPLNYPNGLEYIEEKKLLFLCVTQCDSVLKYHVNDDMSLTRLGMVCKVKSPDGLAIDNNGNLWIASSDGGQPGVAVFDSSGTKLGSIAISNQQSVQNCAFGGAGNKTLYIAAKTGIFSVTTIVGGRSTTGVVTSVSDKNRNNRSNQPITVRSVSALIKNSIQIWSIDGRCLGERSIDGFSKDLTDDSRINSFVKASFPAGVYIVKCNSDGLLQRKMVNTF
jgi:gluconolactonase